MAEDSSSRNANAKPAGRAATNGAPAPTAARAVAHPATSASGGQSPVAPGDKPVAQPTAASLPTPAHSMNSLATTPVPQATVKCPKCGTAVREVARFCQRCHATMRFECPACHHQQRTGGKCEKCGVDFIKYVGAVVAGKQSEGDAIQDKFEQRSTLLRNLLFIPLTGGFSLIRQLLVRGDRKS